MYAQPSHRPQWLIPLLYFVLVSGEFAALTAIMLDLTDRGLSAFAVGVVSSAMWVGIVLGSHLAGILIRWLGQARLIVSATALTTATLVFMGLQSSDLAWVFGVAVMGVAGGVVWVTAESWLAESVPPARRGFFVGIFEAAVGLGLTTGPALIPLSRFLDLSPILVGASLGLIGLLLTTGLLGQAGASHARSSDAGWRAVVAKSEGLGLIAALAAIAAISGSMESGVAALLPSISMRSGFSIDAAAGLGAVIGAGSALIQPPVGVLADRYGTRSMVLISWVIVAMATASLGFAAHQPGYVFWIAGFILGGFGGAVYTLLVIELGHRFRGGVLVTAMAMLVTSYSLGTAIGPALGGWWFDRSQLQGLAAALVVLSGLGLLLACWLPRRPLNRELESR